MRLVCIPASIVRKGLLSAGSAAFAPAHSKTLTHRTRRTRRARNKEPDNCGVIMESSSNIRCSQRVARPGQIRAGLVVGDEIADEFSPFGAGQVAVDGFAQVGGPGSEVDVP